MEIDPSDLAVEIAEPLEPAQKRTKLMPVIDTSAALVEPTEVGLLPLSTARATAWLSIMVRLQYVVTAAGERALMLLVPSLEGSTTVKNKAIRLDADGEAQTRDRVIRVPLLPGVLEMQMVTKDIPRIASVLRSTCAGLVKLTDGKMCRLAELVNPIGNEAATKGLRCALDNHEEHVIPRDQIASVTWSAPIGIVPITAPDEVAAVMPCTTHYSLTACRQSPNGKLTLIVAGTSYELKERDAANPSAPHSLAYMCRDENGVGSVPALVALPENYVIPTTTVSVAMKLSAQDVAANITTNMQKYVNEVRMDGRDSGKVGAANASIARLTGYDAMGHPLPNRENMTRHASALVTNRREVSRDVAYGTSSTLCCYGLAIKDDDAHGMLDKAIRSSVEGSREAGYAPYVVGLGRWLTSMHLGGLPAMTPVERITRISAWVAHIQSLMKEKQENRAKYTR